MWPFINTCIKTLQRIEIKHHMGTTMQWEPVSHGSSSVCCVSWHLLGHRPAEAEEVNNLPNLPPSRGHLHRGLLFVLRSAALCAGASACGPFTRLPLKSLRSDQPASSWLRRFSQNPHRIGLITHLRLTGCMGFRTRLAGEGGLQQAKASEG